MSQDPPAEQSSRINTIALLGRAYSLLGFRIVDGVVGAGYPIKPRYSAVFAQLGPGGMRITDLARGANMTSQSMGELVGELESQGYVRREPDPADGRAKRVMLTELGRQTIAAGAESIVGVEREIVDVIGEEGHQQLRDLLEQLLASQ